MKITSADVDAAYRELEEKDLSDIHRETAKLWLARGIAAVRHHEESEDDSWLFDAEEYLHEALEHAALVTDGPLSADVKDVVARVKAILGLQGDGVEP